MPTALFKPGENCWRVEQARRAAFLIDGDAYFTAFREAVKQARQTVFILGWDIDTRLRLVHDGRDDGLPTLLGEFLAEVVARRRTLKVYILTWDYSMIYTLEREWMPGIKWRWRTRGRLAFQMDGEHPLGASHHQKVVVVDDRIAFVGGLDLTRIRWDTPEHRPHDPRRVEDDATAYPPNHDVQMLVDHDAAAALGTLARNRWYRATGRRPRMPRADEPGDPWPAGVTPDLRDVAVAIARTDSGVDGRMDVREVERLYLDNIAAARHVIYIENQYLTAPVIEQALAARLAEERGPEVVIIAPKRTHGWLAERTMDVLRARLLKRLYEADRYRRLYVYFAHTDGLGDEVINVHSKLLVVDDQLVRIGSANLNNRSMGLDTECDLAVAANGNAAAAGTILGFRNRLLAEHLGTSEARLAWAVETGASVGAAVESLRGGPHTLQPITDSLAEADVWVPDSVLLDPHRPSDAENLADGFATGKGRRRMGLWITALVMLLALAAAWRWTPLHEWINTVKLGRAMAGLKHNPLAPLLVIAGFAAGGLIAMPVTLMIVATAATFGPAEGFAYSLAGVVASAALTYGIGRLLGRSRIRHLAGPRVNRLSRRLGRRGVLAMAFIRVMPVAPFTVVNLVASASHIRFFDYLLGTVVGMAPGILAIALFVDSLEQSIEQPGAMSFIFLAVALLVIALGTVGLRRLLRRGTEV